MKPVLDLDFKKEQIIFCFEVFYVISLIEKETKKRKGHFYNEL